MTKINKFISYISLGYIVLFACCRTYASEMQGMSSIPTAYTDESNTSAIIIESDTLYIYDKTHPLKDTLELMAICSIHDINSDFAEIKSIGGSLYQAFDRVECIVENRLDSDSDSTIIELVFPNYSGELLVEELNTGQLSSTNGSYTFCTDKQLSNVFFEIAPAIYTPSTPIGQLFGLLYMTFDSRSISESLLGYKKVTYIFSSFTDNVFNQYLILSDYIRYVPEGIIWRGFPYHKCSDKEARKHVFPRIAKGTFLENHSLLQEYR